MGSECSLWASPISICVPIVCRIPLRVVVTCGVPGTRRGSVTLRSLPWHIAAGKVPSSGVHPTQSRDVLSRVYAEDWGGRECALGLAKGSSSHSPLARYLAPRETVPMTGGLDRSN
jgi:hypothetical protein